MPDERLIKLGAFTLLVLSRRNGVEFQLKMMSVIVGYARGAGADLMICRLPRRGREGE